MSAAAACGTVACRVTALALAGALALAWLMPARAQLPKKEDTFNISAPYAILIDYESGTVLFEKNADQLMEPSSMAKLMTVEVMFRALKEGKLSPEDQFIISEHAWRHGGAPSHGSTMYAPIHSQYFVLGLTANVANSSARSVVSAANSGAAEFSANKR